VNIQFFNLQNILPIPAQKLKRLIRKVLSGEQINQPGLINICFVDDRQIKKHNARFLKHDSATDVLAFDLSESKKGGIILADIIISTQTALRQSRAYKTTPEHELTLYVAHGILHILGYKDKTAQDIRLMRKKENHYVN
jgi:probable rRNA maturation factor